MYRSPPHSLTQREETPKYQIGHVQFIEDGNGQSSFPGWKQDRRDLVLAIPLEGGLQLGGIPPENIQEQWRTIPETPLARKNTDLWQPSFGMKPVGSRKCGWRREWGHSAWNRQGKAHDQMDFSSTLAPAKGWCLVIPKPVTPWKGTWGSGIWGSSLPDWTGLWHLDGKACLRTHPIFASAPIKQAKCGETLITHTKPWKCRKQKTWASGVTKLLSGFSILGSLGVRGDCTTGGDGLFCPLFLSLHLEGERIPRSYRYLLEKGRALWRRFQTVAGAAPEEDAGFYQSSPLVRGHWDSKARVQRHPTST